MRRLAPLALSASLAALSAAAGGCTARVPTPLNPAIDGSLGTVNRGTLRNGANLARSDSLRWLRPNDRHWGLPRFTHAIERAAAKVSAQRPGSALTVGDLSVAGGGQLSPHFSHRNGRDADLLLYLTTLDGVPVASPGFVSVDTDGLAWDPKGGRYLRVDIERQWLLTRALLSDDEARIQWIFVSEVLEALLIEWARARGDDPEIVSRAQDVMLQPNPGGVHDDHFHVRTACSPEEIANGCQQTGPERPWFAPAKPVAPEPDAALAAYLAAPVDRVLAAAQPPPGSVSTP